MQKRSSSHSNSGGKCGVWVSVPALVFVRRYLVFDSWQSALLLTYDSSHMGGVQIALQIQHGALKSSLPSHARTHPERNVQRHSFLFLARSEVQALCSVLQLCVRVCTTESAINGVCMEGFFFLTWTGPNRNQ